MWRRVLEYLCLQTEILMIFLFWHLDSFPATCPSRYASCDTLWQRSTIWQLRWTDSHLQFLPCSRVQAYLRKNPKPWSPNCIGLSQRTLMAVEREAIFRTMLICHVPSTIIVPNIAHRQLPGPMLHHDQWLRALSTEWQKGCTTWRKFTLIISHLGCI